jgi:phosphoserine aminotransferase
MPAEVLARAAGEILDRQGSGVSVMEMPFTGPEFKAIAARAREDLRALLDIPLHYRVLFMQGGASAQFALVPMNLLRLRQQADFVETGHWSRRAMSEAGRYCRVRVAASAAATGFDRIPPARGWQVSEESAFCHITSNETANGLEFHWTLDTGGVPLVADMTSNFLSRPVDVARYGLIYASAQKNVGPSGLTIVIVREDLIGPALQGTPTVFDYKAHADTDSMVNTPPTWAVYVAGLVFRWLRERGGLTAVERVNARKSARLYAAIDGSDGFYRCPAVAGDRSRTTVCFTLRDRALTEPFLEGAAGCGLVNLRGHVAIGGIRAALFNAMPEAGVEALVDYMGAFAAAHG